VINPMLLGYKYGDFMFNVPMNPTYAKKKGYLILYTIVPIVNSLVFTWFISLDGHKNFSQNMMAKI
jgi:hypothetical protein